jgi:hypothetical protein
MAKIVYCHPSRTTYDYHLYTDLDFWDAWKILKDLAIVRRNFGDEPSGDDFPTQVLGEAVSRMVRDRIEARLRRAVASPPRHVIVGAIIREGSFEFDPQRWYPPRWSRDRMLRFTYRRLPLRQGVLVSPYRTVRVSWVGDKIRVERIQRTEKYDPVIRTRGEALARLKVPSCF